MRRAGSRPVRSCTVRSCQISFWDDLRRRARPSPGSGSPETGWFLQGLLRSSFIVSNQAGRQRASSQTAESHPKAVQRDNLGTFVQIRESLRSYHLHLAGPLATERRQFEQENQQLRSWQSVSRWPGRLSMLIPA